MKIVDAHHHIWDPGRNPHPWLTRAAIPFRYGDYTAIRGPFLWGDYDRVSSAWDVVGSVTMEGEWDPGDLLGEARWLSTLADGTGRPAAHAAQAWLDRADAGDVLEAYGDMALVRSVRHKPRANAAPGGAPGGLTDPAFQRGFALLARHRLMFELQTPWWHLDEAIGLAAHAPDVTIILNHTGLPADRSAEGLAAWQAAMAAFAKLENARVKISGLGLAAGGWNAASNREVIRRTIDLFGPGRCMFASNFPVDSLCASFDDIWKGFDDATSDLNETDRAALFHDTAVRTYGLDAGGRS